MSVRAARTVASLVLLLGALVAVPAAANAATAVPAVTSSVKATISSSSIVTGQSVTATLTATPASTGSAKLQYKSGSTWKTDTRVIAVKAGTGVTTLKPPSTRTYRFSYGGHVSNSFTIKVSAGLLKAAVSSTTVVKGQSVTATLTALPATTGSAKLQYKSGSTWKTDTRVIAVTAGKGVTTLKPPSTRSYRFTYKGLVSNAFTVKVESLPSSFTLTGSGWGHGVGMSQYGAYGMALDGSKAPAILTHYFTGTQVERVDASGGTEFRVQVFGSGADSKDSVDAVVRSPGADSVADGQWQLRFYAADTTTVLETWTGVNNEHLLVGRDGSNVVVTRAGGDSFSSPWVNLQWEATRSYQPTSTENPYVELLNSTTGAAQAQGQYRHGQLFLSVLASRLNVVNSLDLNTEYLYGVAEMPSSWSSEALKAQVIAARGYAVKALTAGLKSACGCNVYDDSRSQNFTGWKKENEGTDAYYGKRWVAAVNATNSVDGLSGDVLTYGTGGVGKIATTYYFSSSGGQTENSEDVWVSSVSYLRSVTDPWSLDSRVGNPNRSWTATLSQASARAAFDLLPDVAKISITERTSGASTAAALTVTATSSTGETQAISGTDDVRIALGVKSPWIWSIKAT